MGEGPERRAGASDTGPAGDWERLRRAAAGERREGPGNEWESLGGGARGGHGSPQPPGSPPSLASLLTLLEAARGMVPRELERQFSALLREVLLTLRALIDWYLERLDGGDGERRVEDIPID